MTTRIALCLAMLLGLAHPAAAQSKTFVAYVGAYISGTPYGLNDMVSVGDAFYISLEANNAGNQPSASSPQWALVGSGTGPAGAAGPLTYEVLVDLAAVVAAVSTRHAG